MGPVNIKVKYFSKYINKLKFDNGECSWVTLQAAENVNLKAGEVKPIQLGVGMELPAGYEAELTLRRNTCALYGIIPTTHCSIIDHGFADNGNQWYIFVYAVRDTKIQVGDRICQFRIVEQQPYLTFEEVYFLPNDLKLDHEKY